MKYSLLNEIVNEIYTTNNNSDSLTALNIKFYRFISPLDLYSFIQATLSEALEQIFYIIVVYLIVCLCIYKLTFLTTTSPIYSLLKIINNVRLPKDKNIGRVLFVVAHPDDECMFFGPLILSLTKRPNTQIYLLCLSFGNYEKQGDKRRIELWRSCERLGIPSSNIILINATNFRDDPNVEWKNESIANLILYTVESLDIKAIFTFDRDGISQHPNHCAVYYATASLCLANLLPKDCKFYTLDSINLLRKYLSILDLICTCLISTNWCILSWEDASLVRDAMKEHKSQMKWFRWLYIYFSRYMFINSMREVNLSDIELEMQIQDNM